MSIRGILRRKRVYKLIIFLAFAGFIFLCFQIFTVQVLNQSNDDAESNNRHKIRSSKVHAKHKIKDGVGPDIKKQIEDCSSEECKLKYNKNVLSPTGKPVFSDIDNIKHHQTFNKSSDSKINHQRNKNKNIVRQSDIVKDSNLQNVIEHSDNSDRQKVGAGIVDEVPLVKAPSVNLLDVDLAKLPRGASVFDARHYIVHSNGSDSSAVNVFTCIHSKEKIPMSAVNDDYCDCDDSTDEPGTNACPNSRFYCSFQLVGTASPTWFPGSRVNDGICDCCDGSDEWQHRKLPDRLLLNDGKEHYGVYQGPCQDRCDSLKVKNKELLLAQQRGAEVKQQYLKAAAGQENPDQHLYGAHGEFLMLSNECFSRTANKYEYVICPFKQITQKDGSDEKVIGRMPQWLSMGGSSGYRLQMTNGDSNQCPGLMSRSTTLIFKCGAENRVDSIQETEVCEYTIHFTTPAVC